MMTATFQDYLQLTKPRIMALLVFTTVTAMFIAAKGSPSLGLLVATALGGALASGGSSAVNQYYDRDMDRKMARTKKRPIAAGRVSPLAGLAFGISLILASTVLLGTLVNWLASSLALAGAVYYIFLYTIILKRNTVVNIVIGGGAGAVPVLVGWAAVTGQLSLEAWLLFAIIFYWTPPHSWALALLVNADYTRAEVPMMPVVRGEDMTRKQILLYSVLLVIVTVSPVAIGMLGVFYLAAALLLGSILLVYSIKLIQEKTGAAAKRMFKYSNYNLALLFLVMIFDQVLF
jgi:protoheme IX farnesyltransferase